MITITPRLDIDADDKYCERCRWMEQCPPGCRIFRKPLQRCLGGGPLRCAECLEAQRDTKESFTAGSAEEVERTPGQPHPYRIVKGCDCGYCNEQREKAKETKP